MHLTDHERATVAKVGVNLQKPHIWPNMIDRPPHHHEESKRKCEKDKNTRQCVGTKLTLNRINEDCLQIKNANLKEVK